MIDPPETGGQMVMTEASQDVSLLLRALRFAAVKHRDQRRKDASASPYINHPICVAEKLWAVGRVRDMATVVAGILHDTIEDTGTSAAELEAEFGRQVRLLVEEVTDDKSLPKAVRKRLQVERAAAKSRSARLIKLADKICNIQDILESPPADWSLERRQEYLRWAGEVVNQLRGTNGPLEEYFDEVCQRARERFRGR